MLIIEKKLSEVFTTNLKKLLGYQDFFILRKATELGKSGNSIRVSITHLPQKPIKSPRDKIIKKADEIKENLIENLAYIFDFDYSVTGYFSPIRISFVIFFKKLKIKQEKDSELYSKFKESLETIFKKDSESRIVYYKKIFNVIHITFEKSPAFHPIYELKKLFFFKSSKLNEENSEKGVIHVYRIELLRKKYSFAELGICKESVYLLIKYIKMLDSASEYIKREHRWFHIYLEFGEITRRGVTHFYQQIREKIEPCPYLFLGKDKAELSDGDLWIPNKEELKLILHLNNKGDNSSFSEYHIWYQRNKISIKCQELNLFAYHMKIKYNLIWDKNYNNWKAPPQKTFKINEYLSLKLEDNQTNIYVKKKHFSHCKYLLFSFSHDELSEYEEIDSIDEIKNKYDSTHEGNKTKISPEVEFWGHCSNLQAWYEHNYDTRILHSNIAFPLLKELSKYGDPLAKKVFKNEIALRFESNFDTVIKFLLNGEYLAFLDLDEIKTLSENLDFLKWPEDCILGFFGQWISKGKYSNDLNFAKSLIEMREDILEEKAIRDLKFKLIKEKSLEVVK